MHDVPQMWSFQLPQDNQSDSRHPVHLVALITVPRAQKAKLLKYVLTGIASWIAFWPTVEQDDILYLNFSVSLCHRFSLLGTLKIPKSSFIVIGHAASDPPEVTDHHVTQGDGHVIWMAWLRGESLLGPSDPLLGQTDRVLQDTQAWRGRSRGRRHANNGGSRSHGQLMRVACVLGTCQVQNLSHRLYQLIGQSGKEDSSPINPHSPHSYG